MLAKLVKFLKFADDLAEVLVFHVFFSKANWKKTTAVLIVAGLALSTISFGPVAKTVVAPTAAEDAARGYQLLVKGKADEAVRLLQRAVAKDSTRALYHQRLGLAYLEAGKNEPALTSLQTAYRLSPSRTTLFYMGCVYQSMKLNDVAIGVFNQVKATSSREALARESASGYEPVAEAKIGECYIKKGELDRAIESLSRTIALYPNYPHSYFYLGVAYWDKGNPDLGVEQFFKVIELYPGESAAYYNVACYYAIKGIPDLALTWLEKALRAGFVQFKHMETDEDMDSIRNLPEYRRLVTKYRAIAARAK